MTAEPDEYGEESVQLSDILGDLPSDAFECAWSIAYAPPRLDPANPAAFVRGAVRVFGKSNIEAGRPEAVRRVLQLAGEQAVDRTAAIEVWDGWAEDLELLGDYCDVGVHVPDGAPIDEWLQRVACNAFERFNRVGAATIAGLVAERLGFERDNVPDPPAPPMMM